MQIPTEVLPSYRDNPVPEPQNATLNDPDGWFVEYLTGGAKTSAGQSVTEANAMRIAAVFACARCIAEDIGKMPLNVYRRLKPRGRELVDTIPLYSLLHDAPNRAMDSMSFRQRLTTDALLGGNGYAEIIRTRGGDALELTPICRSRVVPWVDNDGSLYYDVYEQYGTVRTLDSSDMFHLRGLGDGYIGWSVIRLARETIGGAMAAEEHANSTFADAAIPSGVLEHPQAMKKEARDHLIKTWEARHNNKRKIAVLEGGLKYNALSISNKDSEFLESRQFSVEEIARWFRVPPHKIQHLLRATFSNIESQNTEYVVDCLLSWAVRWEHEINRKLIPKRQSDLFAKLLFEILLRGDTAARSAFYREMLNTGVFCINDAREKEDLNPVEGGDTHFVPSTMMPLELAAEGPQFQQQKPPATEPQPAKNGDNPSQTDNLMTQRLIEAHMDVVADATSRLLKVEADRLDTAIGKPNLATIVEKFYVEHRTRITDALAPPLEAFAQSLWLLSASVGMPAEAKLVVIAHISGVADRHLAVSKAEMQDARALERWTNGERALQFAAGELSSLAAEIRNLVARYRPEWLSGAA